MFSKNVAQNVLSKNALRYAHSADSLFGGTSHGIL